MLNEIDCENVHRTSKSTNLLSTPRTVTLQMLLGAGILQPGQGTMSIEYLGQRFVGDLLDGGKIRSQETDIIFASPSAWAIACKRFINPEKKSGCGWASVKYKGKKLDAYKNIWYKKRKEQQRQRLDNTVQAGSTFSSIMANTIPYQRIIVKHNTIANRTLTHDANTLIECVPFSNLGKIQPFLISFSTNAAFLMDFHCHLTKTEVSGYLGGHWDINTHNLQITQAFPCRNTKADRENASQVETEIQKAMEREKLALVGWYHSHPFMAAAPTLRDVDAQLDYQIKMKGVSDNSYTPCVGIIIAPYNYENTSLESSIIAYWVIPPPEAKPNEYGRPMLMSYSVIQDLLLTQTVKEEMRKCIDYYKKQKDFINFSERYINNTLYIDKLKSTLISKFPREESETILWSFIKDILGYRRDENETLLSIPSVSSSSIISNLNSSNMLCPSDISSILFNSGKFPSASSLLGLPDPMAHSTLAANNMFLSTNLFKMQELLKPLSTPSGSGTTIKTSKLIDHSTKTSLKIPNETKLIGKTEIDLSTSNSGKSSTATTIDLSTMTNNSELIDYSLNLSKDCGNDKITKIYTNNERKKIDGATDLTIGKCEND